MKFWEDICALSIPFTAGVGIGALLGLTPAWGLAFMAAALACLALMVCRKSRSLWLAALLFLLLGAFTWGASAGGTTPEGRATRGLKAGGTPPEGRATREFTPENSRFPGTPIEAKGPSDGDGGVSPKGELLKWDLPPAAIPANALQHLSTIIRRIPFPHGETNALLLALLTGRRELLDRATMQAFRAAGASHILALSGLHLGIIYLILSKLLFFLGNSRRAWILRSAIIVGFSAFYTIMTGAGPSLVRAFIFITIAEIARNCPGRRKTPAGVLCTALLIQLCLRPGVILSLGFQLSYLAMLGIFLLFPRLRDWYPLGGKLQRWDPVRRAWESMALSASCQVFTAPLVWLRFHIFPQYFLLANLISLPLTWGLIAGGLACTALESIKISPRFLTRAVDWMAMSLRDSLAVIAAM